MAQPLPVDPYQTIYAHCCRILGDSAWGRIRAAMDDEPPPENFPYQLKAIKDRLDLPDFIDDVARIEWSQHQLLSLKSTLPKKPVKELTVNPAFSLVQVSWKNLPAIFHTGLEEKAPQPLTSPIHVMIWYHPETGRLHLREADDLDLLALKIVV
jgi:hypothetical protein